MVLSKTNLGIRNINEKHFDAYRRFYEEIITFNDYIEVRNFNTETGEWLVYYPSDWESLKKILVHTKHPFIAYVGCNPRQEKSMKDADIKYRSTFYLDVEATGDKPPLVGDDANIVYKERLEKTINYIAGKLENKFGIKPSWINISGRGMHVGYKIQPFDTDEYEQAFREWIRYVQDWLMKDRPYKDIKFDDPTINVGRIGGAPGTRHNKYPESPLRKLIHVDYGLNNDICSYLAKINDKLKEKPVPTINTSKYKWNIDNIHKAPEYKIFFHTTPAGEWIKPPSGSINNRLRFALKLLMRESGFSRADCEKVARKIQKQGYPYKPMYLSPDRYKRFEYSQSILNNWCLDNYKWCVRTGFKLPYPLKFKGDTEGASDPRVFDFESDYSSESKIKRFLDLIEYIADFHTEHSFVSGMYRIYFDNALEYNLKNIVDLDLLRFIKNNNLWYRIRRVMRVGGYNPLDDISDFVEGVQ